MSKKAIKVKTTRWNVLDYLTDERAMIGYLKAALDEGSPKLFIIALGDVARARGINEVAKKMKVSRESLYKSFSGNVKPNFETIYNAIDTLGFKISITKKRALHRPQ